MRAEWDESYFDAQQQDAAIYWVCFWIVGDIGESAMHDPHRITGAESVEEVLAWIAAEKGERSFELLVETVGHSETRDRGWVAYRELIRLAGDYRPEGSTFTVVFTSDR